MTVCPSHLVVKEDKVRVVRDWSNVLYQRNFVLGNPPVQHGATDEFLQVLTAGAYMGGGDLQDCFLHWLVAPTRRRYLGRRRSMSGTLGVYFFMPIG